MVSHRRFSICAATLVVCAWTTAAAGQQVAYRNTNPSVAYVGSASCEESGCHGETYREYFLSAHGTEMTPANTASDLARVERPVIVFNPKNKHYYKVFEQNGELYESVFELDGKGRKIYDLAHKMDFVVGGTIVGYSYLFQLGPWMLQGPLSYYARSKTWELSPGYVQDDLGFTRVATTGCLMCHNGQPDPIPLRDGSYKQPAFRFGETSMGCETCHGPGALHVEEMRSRRGVQLKPGEIDTSIVNPAHLPPRLADDLCQECHQQGVAQVLMPGKSVLDYRPGEPLGDTIAKFMLPIKASQRPQAKGAEGHTAGGNTEPSIEWKNSALEMSKCYQATHGQITCGTCHSIHHAPKPGEEKAAYRAACLTCHTVKSCTLRPEDPRRIAAADYCIECHMEKQAVAGVAHSNDTKHRIVRYPGQPLPDVAYEQPGSELPGLLWINRPDGESDAQLPGIVQLEAYFTAARKDPSLWPLWFRKLNELSKTDENDPTVLNSMGAVALAETKDNAAAENDFSRALKDGSEEPTTFMNLASALANLGHGRQAEAVLERGVSAYPYSGILTEKLAQQFAADGEVSKARKLVRQYRAEFPEDATAQEVEKQLDGAGSDDPLMPQGARERR